ncbi:hypothetical protein L6452_08976 [Arctium lappa]|uniref:Uncharacterized protein n=1 Tax=Arctium lappa TaxID=4217 RepID=A0ACB9DIZ6_ARCLA|nr:hypothetical protein L6452_08976 [Arctium lappa]
MPAIVPLFNFCSTLLREGRNRKNPRLQVGGAGGIHEKNVEAQQLSSLDSSSSKLRTKSITTSSSPEATLLFLSLLFPLHPPGGRFLVRRRGTD